MVLVSSRGISPQKTHQDQHSISELSDWKDKVTSAWPSVKITSPLSDESFVKQAEPFTLQVNAFLGELTKDDVVVECIIGDHNDEAVTDKDMIIELNAVGNTDNGNQVYSLECNEQLSGQKFIKIRMYPYHELLTHKFELGCMVWLES